MSPYLLNPHISLLYKEGLPTQEKLKLPEKYLVSSIALVTRVNTTDPNDYGNWKVVFEKELE